ncbi:YHS domain-containing protein [Loktanella ponticola]|uniref:YHS domain-containing protein n=1 Tax=Yoonia ponticola TaxID=1524255 RepID=A0A7W9BJK7_9RHOB|nr:YHS domain-containing (seleno)protein [Yoonia ponticola]MBB5721758.1 YHS domain-containing protein [Yoonia ponticola]
MTFSRRHFLTLSAAASFAAAAPSFAFAQQAIPIYAEDGIAIDGTDAVAYFTEGAPVAGSAEFTFDWQGATWRFSTAENRDTFAADPTAYAPQYGGYCAYAIADSGALVSTTPEAWSIVDGKLYLNYSNRIQRRWERDIAGYIAAGDAKWPEIIAE